MKMKSLSILTVAHVSMSVDISSYMLVLFFLLINEQIKVTQRLLICTWRVHLKAGDNFFPHPLPSKIAPKALKSVFDIVMV